MPLTANQADHHRQQQYLAVLMAPLLLPHMEAASSVVRVTRVKHRMTGDLRKSEVRESAFKQEYSRSGIIQVKTRIIVLSVPSPAQLSLSA